MKRVSRFAGAAATALLAVVFAGPASAAILPKRAVTTTNSGGANVIISGGVSNPAEDPFHRIQIFVPTGFALNAPVGGTTVGSATGRVLVKDVDASQEQNFTGKLVAIGTNDPAVAWENANCDKTTHAAAWMMSMTMNDGAASIPIFVDKTTGSEAAFGPYKLVVCMRSPDLPQADPNRSPVGTKLNSLALTLTGFKVPTAGGDYRWRSLWTPYTPGTANVNTAGQVEAQSVVRIPAGTLSLAAKKVKVTVKGRVQTQVRLSGRLAIAGKAARRTPVALSHGASKARLVALGTVRTDGAGRYVLSSRLTRSTYFQAGVTIARQELGPGGCTASFGASVKCVNASVGGARVLSRPIRVAP